MTNTIEPIKVEIKNLDTGEWQWLGKMNAETLRKLCIYADQLSDEATTTKNPDNTNTSQ